MSASFVIGISWSVRASEAPSPTHRAGSSRTRDTAQASRRAPPAEPGRASTGVAAPPRARARDPAPAGRADGETLRASSSGTPTRSRRRCARRRPGARGSGAGSGRRVRRGRSPDAPKLRLEALERDRPACDVLHPDRLADTGVVEDEARPLSGWDQLEADDRRVLAGLAPVELQHSLRLDRPDA